MKKAIKKEFVLFRIERSKGANVNGSKAISFHNTEYEAIARMLKERDNEIKNLGSAVKSIVKKGYIHTELRTEDHAILWYITSFNPILADWNEK